MSSRPSRGSRGRQIRSSSTVPVSRRSVVAPRGPSSANNDLASAAPLCTDTTAARTSAGAGTSSRPGRPPERRRSCLTPVRFPPPPLTARGLDLAEARHRRQQADRLEQTQGVVLAWKLGQHRAEVPATWPEREDRATRRHTGPRLPLLMADRDEAVEGR